MKKILITISGLQFHKDEGAKNRLNSFIDSYSNSGHKVDVLLFFSLKSFLFLHKKKSFLNKRARWILFPALPIGKNSFITDVSKYLNQFIFFIFSRLKSYDIIQAEVRGEIGKYKSKNSIFIVDFHGDSVDETKFRNGNIDNWLSNYLLKVQKTSLQYADNVIAVSENLIQKLEENTNQKILNYNIISCGVDLERFNHKELSFRTNKLSTNKINIGYLGGLQEWQNIKEIIKISRELMNLNKDIFFNLFTNSSIEAIQGDLETLGKENYSVKALNFNEVPDHIKDLDAGFLLRDNLSLNIVSSPTKTAEYLASGVPVICTVFSGDYKKSIDHGVEGFVLTDINPSLEQIHDLSTYLRQVKNQRSDFRQLCQKASEKLTWKKEFADFENNILMQFSKKQY